MKNSLNLYLDEQGSALPAVLIMIVIISLMVGVIMAGTVMQSRFIQSDVHAVQARYTAEGAIFQYLSENKLIVGDSLDIILPDSQRATVFTEPFGGYLKIVSEVGDMEDLHRTEVLVGEKGSARFNKAIVLGDTHSKLKLAGDTRITGDIITGPLGVKKSNLRGEIYSGQVHGEVVSREEFPLDDFESSLYKDEVERLQSLLNQYPEETIFLKKGRYNAAVLIQENASRTFFSAGNIELFSEEKVKWPPSLTVIAKGSITLSGNFEYGSYTQLVSDKTIHLKGNIRGKNGLFYASKGIFIKDGIRCSGQFISEQQIRLSGRSYLKYPSVLYLSRSVKDYKGWRKIEILENAALDGVALLPRAVKYTAKRKPKITIGSKGTIRGLVYSAGQTELYGQVLGTIATYQFFLYETPTSYINWLKNSVVDISKRPEHFGVPIGIAKSKNYEILAWREP